MFCSKNALLAVSLCAALVPGAALAADNNGGGPGAKPLNATVGSLAPNQGHFLCTAAINSTGTVATALAGSHIDSAHTFLIVTGQYQVAFLAPCGNVQAVNGWMRVVEPDTLTTGTTGPIYCTVADRFGVTNAVFIECFNNAGALTNSSFTISASR
jgi:hypothetical protein